MLFIELYRLGSMHPKVKVECGCHLLCTDYVKKNSSMPELLPFHLIKRVVHFSQLLIIL